MTHAGAACSRCVNACSLINSIAFTKTRHVPYLNIEDQSWLPACCTSGRGVCSTDHPHGLHLQTMWCCLLQIGFSLAPLLPSALKDMAAWVHVFSFSFVVQVWSTLYSEIIFETLYSDLLNGALLILHGVSADDGFWKWYTLWSASSRKFFVLAYAVIREKV